MLTGHYMRLRIMDSNDAEYVRNLRNSPHVYRNFQNRFFISDIEQQKFLESLAGSQSKIFFIGETIEPTERFGVFFIKDIDYRNQRGEVGVFLDERGLGKGVLLFEGSYLLHNYAFQYLNLNKVIGEVLPENTKAIRLNEAIGMNVEAIRRNHVYYDGAFHDLMQFAMFRDDFYSSPTRVMKQFHQTLGRAESSLPQRKTTASEL